MSSSFDHDRLLPHIAHLRACSVSELEGSYVRRCVGIAQDVERMRPSMSYFSWRDELLAQCQMIVFKLECGAREDVDAVLACQVIQHAGRMVSMLHTRIAKEDMRNSSNVALLHRVKELGDAICFVLCCQWSQLEREGVIK